MTSSLDGSVNKIDELVRGYLVRGEDEPQAYRGYIYLLLDTSADSEYNRDIAKGFLALFDDITLVPKRLDTSKLALVLAPFTEASAAAQCTTDRCAPSYFLEYYDRQRARTLWQMLGQDSLLPPAVLVYSPVPLSLLTPALLRTVWVASFEESSLPAMSVFREFRKRTVRGRFDDMGVRQRLKRLVSLGVACWLVDMREGSCPQKADLVQP